jgi:hypothetical protein
VPRALVLACTAVLLGACMGAPVDRPQPAYLRVDAEPNTTTVYESDRFLGTARLLASKPKALRPGVKYLTFKAPGYFPHDLRVELPAGETKVKIKLRQIPP